MIRNFNKQSGAQLWKAWPKVVIPVSAHPSKLMLTILGGVATWEREIMLERQREGIESQGGGEMQRTQADRRASGGADQGVACRR
jgi:hypothetical protein